MGWWETLSEPTKSSLTYLLLEDNPVTNITKQQQQKKMGLDIGIVGWLALIVSWVAHFFAPVHRERENDKLIEELSNARYTYKKKDLHLVSRTVRMFIVWWNVFEGVTMGAAAFGYAAFLRDPAYAVTQPWEYDVIIGCHFSVLIVLRISFFMFFSWFPDRNWRSMSFFTVLIAGLGLEGVAFAFLIEQVITDTISLMYTKAMALVGSSCVVLYLLLNIVIMGAFLSDEVKSYLTQRKKANRASSSKKPESHKEQ